jgi:hypothetical protein
MISRMMSLSLGIALVVTSPVIADVSVSGELFSPIRWGPSQIESQVVEYSFQITSDGGVDDLRFLNVVRDDGTWVVRNVPVGFEGGPINMASGIDAALLVGGAQYQTTLDPSVAINAPAFSSGVVHTLSTPISYLQDAEFGLGDLGPFDNDPPVPYGGPVSFGPLQNFTHHEGMPDIAQGKDECVPTAAANSVKWLSDTYNLGLTMTTEQIRDVLKDKDHMLTNLKPRPGPSTSPLPGTYLQEWLSGKQKFTSENRLPITTHEIRRGANDMVPIASIIAEMEKGQDVEIILAKPTKFYGHAVTLVGTYSFGGFGTALLFNDPADKKTQTQSVLLGPDGQLFLGSYPGWEIRTAVAESVYTPDGGSSWFLLLLSMAVMVAYRYLRLLRR